MDLVTFAAGASCALLSAGLVWAVVSPRVRDGVALKLGLILMALGFVAMAAALMDAGSLPRAILLVNLGALVAGLALCARFRRAAHWHLSSLLAPDARPDTRAPEG